MTSVAPGENTEAHEAAEALTDDPYSLAWRWLDFAKANRDSEALENTRAWLEAAITEADPKDHADYAKHFGALQTYAFMPVWEAMVNNGQVTADDRYKTRLELCKILDYYPLHPEVPNEPFTEQVLQTMLMTMLISSRLGIPLPEAPYRDGIGVFIFDNGNGTYNRISPVDREGGRAVHIDVRGLLTTPYGKARNIPQKFYMRVLTAATEESKALILAEAARGALVILANNQSPPAPMLPIIQAARGHAERRIENLSYPIPY